MVSSGFAWFWRDLYSSCSSHACVAWRSAHVEFSWFKTMDVVRTTGSFILMHLLQVAGRLLESLWTQLGATSLQSRAFYAGWYRWYSYLFFRLWAMTLHSKQQLLRRASDTVEAKWRPQSLMSVNVQSFFGNWMDSILFGVVILSRLCFGILAFFPGLLRDMVSRVTWDGTNIYKYRISLT